MHDKLVDDYRNVSSHKDLATLWLDLNKTNTKKCDDWMVNWQVKKTLVERNLRPILTRCWRIVITKLIDHLHGIQKPLGTRSSMMTISDVGDNLFDTKKGSLGLCANQWMNENRNKLELEKENGNKTSKSTHHRHGRFACVDDVLNDYHWFGDCFMAPFSISNSHTIYHIIIIWLLRQ